MSWFHANGSCDPIVSHLETFRTANKFVTSPFLISNIWFLILTNPFRNATVSACSIDCSSAAEMNEMSDYGTVP